MHTKPTITLEKTDCTRNGFYIVGIHENAKALRGEAHELDKRMQGALSQALSSGYKAETGEMRLMFGDKVGVLMVGTGKSGKMSAEKTMNVIATAGKKLRESKITSFCVMVDTFSGSDAGFLLAQGLGSGLHRFTEYKTKDLDKLNNVKSVTLMTKAVKKHEKHVQEALVLVDAVTKTRDVINTPPNVANPQYMVDYAKKLFKGSKVQCEVLDEKECKKLGMGGMLGVGMGSASKPRMLILKYKGGAGKPLVLVGKGITFDTGGYNLKPTNYINTMKDDKGGAVAVLHTIYALSQLKVKTHVVGILAFAENMISSTAYRPDDILKMRNGKTVEIGNTDAEGRLVLADALSYACEMKPKGIVDIATLTGASIIALGHFTISFVGNQDSMVNRVKKASDQSHERAWQLPLWDEYFEGIKSDIADMKNVTDGMDAGVIIGGIFLKQFVEDSVPWAHLDIGSTVFTKADRGMKQRGATGVGVRLLYQLAKNYR